MLDEKAFRSVCGGRQDYAEMRCSFVWLRRRIAVMQISKLTQAIVLGLIAAPVFAASTQINSRGALGGTDAIDWGQLGAPLTNVPNGTAVTSGGGLPATVSGGSSQLTTSQQNAPGPWNGNFAPGDNLLAQQPTSAPQPITITFATPVQGVGTQMNVNSGPVTFNGVIKLFDTTNTLLATFSSAGIMNSLADNSAVFLGALDSTADIKSVQFSTTDPFGIGINKLSIVPTPLPAAFPLLAAGLAGLAMVGRRRRTS
jgi:hypothetical protein